MATVILPGDCLPSTSNLDQSRNLHLGPGLQSSTSSTSAISTSTSSTDLKGKGREEIVTANKAGLLGSQTDSKSSKFWVESFSKRVRFIFLSLLSFPHVLMLVFLMNIVYSTST